MKKSVSDFILLTLLLAFISCTRQQQMPRLLVDADSAYMRGAYDQGDSLLSLYQALSDKSNDEAVIRYQELVEMEQSFARGTIGETDLRMAEDLCRYYEYNSLRCQHAQALLFLGKVFINSDDFPSASKALLEAQGEARQEGDTRLQCLVSRDRGDVYFLQRMYDECIPCYEEYYRLAVANRDTLRMARAAHCMARVCIINQQIDSCIAYYKEAIRLGEQAIHQESIVPQSKNWLANVYIQIEEYDSARVYLTHGADDDANWAYLYMGEGKVDSAVYYFRNALGRYKWLGETNVLHELALLERQRGNRDAALNYYEQLAAAKDSLMVMTRDEQTKQTEAQFNFTSVKHELEEAERDRTRMQWLVAALVVLLVLLVLIVVISWVLYQRNKKSMRIQNLLLEKDKENYALRQNDAGYQEEHNRRIAQMESLELYQRLTNPVTGRATIMSEEDWKELAIMVENTYPGFTHNLLSRHGLSETELKICYLIKLEKVTNNQIADYLNKAPSSISSARRRMFKKLSDKEGSSDDFNDFIARM